MWVAVPAYTGRSITQLPDTSSPNLASHTFLPQLVLNLNYQHGIKLLQSRRYTRAARNMSLALMSCWPRLTKKTGGAGKGEKIALK